ncbi:host-nuclease inhibitor Gam family protein [Variovorax paradoxus]|uniref:host-nuclease inhibitor Gam family protein n=1 Tax=Variovorax paradoxus TaxID=34073 RepID=UPI001ABCCA40
MNAPFTPMQEIEIHARAYREALDILTERATVLNDELEAAKRKSMKGLRNAAAAVTKTGDDLRALIDSRRDLFAKPKSVVFSGVRCGLKKGRGSIEWGDDEQVVKRIRKYLPDQFDVLVKTTEKPQKDALGNLSADDLKRIGVTVEGSGDVVFAQDTTSEVDKLVKALIKGATAAAEDEAES